MIEPHYRCNVCDAKANKLFKYTQMNYEVIKVCNDCLKELSYNKSEIFRELFRNNKLKTGIE